MPTLELLQHLVPDRILPLLPQDALLNMARLNSWCRKQATAQLYKTIAVVVTKEDCPDRQRPLFVVVLTPDKAQQLLHTLQCSPHLVSRIKSFHLGPCHTSEYESVVLEAQFWQCLNGSEALQLFTSYKDEWLRLGQWPNLRYAHATSTAALAEILPCVSRLSLNAVAGSDVATPPALWSLDVLEIDTPQHSGLDLLANLTVPAGARLRPRRLAVCHNHGVSRLRFDVLASTVSLTSVRLLRLHIGCASSGCECLVEFASAFRLFVVSLAGLPNLSSLELCFFPQEEWLTSCELLDQILSPYGELLSSLKGVADLTFDMNTCSYKLYADTGMLAADLNRNLNEKLLQSFFLPLAATARDNGALTKLALPDFFMGFLYYKNFHESFLHTCRCDGCAVVLQRLEETFLPIGEIGGDVLQSLFLLLGLVLDSLQNDRRLRPISGFDAVSPLTLVKNESGRFHRDLHHGEACLCSDGDGLEEQAVTYLVHQCRPFLSFLWKLFPQLRQVMIHGIYFEKQGDVLQCVSDPQLHPSEITRGCLMPNSTYGVFSLANESAPGLSFG